MESSTIEMTLDIDVCNKESHTRAAPLPIQFNGGNVTVFYEPTPPSVVFGIKINATEGAIWSVSMARRNADNIRTPTTTGKTKNTKN